LNCEEEEPFVVNPSREGERKQTKVSYSLLLQKADNYLEIENASIPVENEDGSRRVCFRKVDFNLLLYLPGSYILAYFFLLMLIALIFVGANAETEECSLPFVLWYKMSACFYLLAFLATVCLGFALQRSHTIEEAIIIRHVILVFNYHTFNWAYACLVLIELWHFSLTIWGGMLYFQKSSDAFSTCYSEITMLINFLLILVILGFTYACRFLFVIFQFKMGPRFYRFLRSRIAWVRAYEQQLRVTFPVYIYSHYIRFLRDEWVEVGTNYRTKSFEEAVCPICVEQFLPNQDIVILPCNIKHIYHPNCVKAWLEKNDSCPLCKAQVF